MHASHSFMYCRPGIYTALRWRVCVFTVPFHQWTSEEFAVRERGIYLASVSLTQQPACIYTVDLFCVRCREHSWHSGKRGVCELIATLQKRQVFKHSPLVDGTAVGRIRVIRWSPCAKWVACLWIMHALSAACSCFRLSMWAPFLPWPFACVCE